MSGCCVVSVALAARYGYRGADTEIDGVISAIVFGLIALCACLFDAAAVRLWFMRHHAGSVIIGMIAAAALIVTFTNSLGAIASRADSTQAERVRAKADQAEDRAELARITGERGALKFTPTTDDAVKAARDTAATAERIRVAECGNGDPRQRGPNCRQRETEEQSKRDALGSVPRSRPSRRRESRCIRRIEIGDRHIRPVGQQPSILPGEVEERREHHGGELDRHFVDPVERLVAR